MTACAWCITQPPPMTPMMVAEEAREEMTGTQRTSLPFGFGILVGPKGVAVNPANSEVPKPYTDPQKSPFLNGPSGPRMFLVTFSDPSPGPMQPPDADTEEAHVARVGDLFKAGRLHFVGHDPNGREGYMMLSAPSLDDAWDTARQDPLVAFGFYRAVSVKEVEGPYPWHQYGGPSAVST